MKITIEESYDGELVGDLSAKWTKAIDAASERLQKAGLLPLQEPLYNVREAAKQLLMLEDHLLHVEKRCDDCIKKHFLTAEALLEEAIALDEQSEQGWLPDVVPQLRALWSRYIQGDDKPKLMQAVRGVRKVLLSRLGDDGPLSKAIDATGDALQHGGEIKVLEDVTRQVTNLYKSRLAMLQSDIGQLLVKTDAS